MPSRPLNGSEFGVRRQAIASRFGEAKIDALLVTALPNIRYLTGFTGSNGALLVTGNRSHFFTDPRYEIQAAAETGLRPTIVRGPMWPSIARTLKRIRIRRTGFEHARLPYHVFDALRRDLPLASVLNPVMAWIEELRMVKSEPEVAAIRKAVQINSKSFDATMRRIKPGVTERDVAAELEYQMRRAGADGASFDTIVAAGERAALPHARPGGGTVKPNQLLLIDMGATQAGYTSDMTRVICFGRPKPKARWLYGAVLEAQLAAIAAVRAGVTAASVDRAARDVLTRHGIEKTFIHSTGHGLGLEIHEAPRLGKKDKTKLAAGMVVTIEPGAYIEGEGGVRIEDTVLVTPTGCEVLTPTPKELLTL